MPRRIKHYNWTGLYDQSWKGTIVPGAFVHPAKYSRALIRRIYEFMFKQKWLHCGEAVVVDSNLLRSLKSEIERGEYGIR